MAAVFAVLVPGNAGGGGVPASYIHPSGPDRYSGKLSYCSGLSGRFAGGAGASGSAGAGSFSHLRCFPQAASGLLQLGYFIFYSDIRVKAISRIIKNKAKNEIKIATDV